MLADLFEEHAEALVADLDAAASCWDVVVAAEPSLERTVGGSELDRALEAMADLVDMKSPHMSGHSRGVANLAAEAGRVSGLPEEEIAALRRAGFLHDLGRLGVSNSIWDKRGPVSPAEMERVRLHPPARREWPAGLTAREVEVLGLLARGYSNKQIAERLVVTPKTVSSHVEHVYRKLAVSSRAAATHFAMAHGLVGSFEAAS